MIFRKKMLNILLVEDNIGDIRLTQEAFKEGSVPMELNIAMDGEEAMQYLYGKLANGKQSLPDLILLDLNLPKKDGREVLQEIKKNPLLKNIPVIILTTSNEEQDIIGTYSLHANCYINKPVDFDQFFSIIRQIEQFWLSTVILPSVSL